MNHPPPSLFLPFKKPSPPHQITHQIDTVHTTPFTHPHILYNPQDQPTNQPTTQPTTKPTTTVSYSLTTISAFFFQSLPSLQYPAFTTPSLPTLPPSHPPTTTAHTSIKPTRSYSSETRLLSQFGSWWLVVEGLGGGFLGGGGWRKGGRGEG